MSGPKSAHLAARNTVVVLSILLLVVLAERWRWFARLESIAQPSLTWIWARVNPNEVKARAFYAVRDFALATAPAQARLDVLGDPEYIVYLNGTRVGSGSYRADAPLDSYQVGDLLVAGSNRVVIELRSPIGSGGATLRIAAEGRTLVATGGDWSIQEAAWQGALSRGPLSRSSTAVVLGVSPFGRWGTPGSTAIRARFSDQVTRQGLIGARYFRQPYAAGAWQRQARSAKSSRRVSAATEFDFGAEVEGFLQLSFDRGPERTALVRAAADSAPASGWLPDAIVISVNGSRVWRDAVPRRFRYVEVVGLKGLRWAGFYPLRRTQEANLSRALSPRGLFNLRVDPQRWPAVDEIWKSYLDRPRAASAALPAPGVRRAGGARIPERPRARAGRHNPEKH
jgi:hypothetical protein